jgi:Bacterioferritin (cytochrome b1)
MDKQKSIEALQFFVTGLSEGAFVHKVQGVDILRKCMATVADDPITYDMLKAYLLDEEEDQFWSEEQLELIEKIGYQNWLIKQM